MDKTWMKADRRSLEFRIGLEGFVNFAVARAENPNYIFCPCVKCCNVRGGSVQFIKDHVICNGIMTNYINWTWHGECSVAASNSMSKSSKTVEMNSNLGVDLDKADGCSVESDEFNKFVHDEFNKFVQDGDKPLYPGCTTSTKMDGRTNSNL
ncbi:hypothetical protein M5689_011816 [Euphorbia peplus]|nr:hypothetical protein M5689_011816 [Euphorbia peplus]